MGVSILAGENTSLLQGDIEMLRNELKNFMLIAEVENEDRINEIHEIITRLNDIDTKFKYLEDCVQSLERSFDNRLKSIENLLRGRTYEREKTNFS
jgi:hypothetical protein